MTYNETSYSHSVSLQSNMITIGLCYKKGAKIAVQRPQCVYPLATNILRSLNSDPFLDRYQRTKNEKT